MTAGSDGAADEVLHRAIIDLFSAEDAGEIAGIVLHGAAHLPGIATASVWVPADDGFECRGAIGFGDDSLLGRRVAADRVNAPIDPAEGAAVLAVGIAAGERLTVLLRVARGGSADGGDATFGDAEQEQLRFLADAAGRAIEGTQRLSTARAEADERARDLAAVTEMSREITATLDLDRVLRAAVNLASRVLRFDRGAIALYENGKCDVRAVAGADGISPKDPALKDLAVRAAWAGGSGERFYVSDRTDPATDAEFTFVRIFGEDMARDRADSGLYLPLKDEEGVVGILLFEAARVNFASPRDRELAEIIANQTTVAVRNAQLYRQVPLADTLGALAAHQRELLAMPRRRRLLYAAIAAAGLMTVTLVRWPYRVDGTDPVLRPLARADVRPIIDGVVDRVFVREGMAVERGAPVAQLRDEDIRSEREVALASATAAEREASMAEARRDAAGEELERGRVAMLRREAAVLDEEIAAATVRSPIAGIVLTARPEERADTHVDAGELLVTVARADTLEVEFSVNQDDIERVRVGQEVRLRVSALPQRTFSGRVISLAALGVGDSASVRFPIRALVANEENLLRPGMTAYARVLTEPMSLGGRLLRAPMRFVRLSWWRIWS